MNQGPVATKSRSAGPRAAVSRAARAFHATRGVAATRLFGGLSSQTALRASPRVLGLIVLQIFLTGVAYYVTTRMAWVLCFPHSKVSLIFPPHAVLIAVLLLVPTRHWWAYTLSTVVAHFLATQQAQWPVGYALTCEAFDAAQHLLTAGGIRLLIKSPLAKITLRDAVIFVLIAVIIVPFGTAFWGAAFTVANNFGTHYWIEWRNLGVSNGVTAVVLVPALLLAAERLSRRGGRIRVARLLEALVLEVGIVALGWFVFAKVSAGPDTSPAFLYAPIPLLIWAAMRFGLGGISAAMLVVTVLAVWGAMHGNGPFLQQTPAENALALQMFLIVTGTPLMFLTIVLADDKRSQLALHESEERVSLAAEAAQIGAWELNTTSKKLWVSDKWRELYGFGPDEAVTYEDFRQRVHPEDRARRDTIVEQAIARGGRYDITFRVIWPDGTLRWMTGRAHCLADAEGVICRLLGVSVDVTKRKEAEDLFHLATEASPSGTLLVDEQGRIQLVNAHIEELFGYKREELINESIYNLISDRFWSAHPGLRERLIPDLHTHELQRGWELFARRKDGSEFPVEVGLNAIDTPRGLLVLANVVDISARKAAEEEARHQREQINLLSRVSLLGEMSASLAHELSQPLSAIIMTANAGRRLLDRGKEDPAIMREILVNVASDGRRAHEIIQNVRNTIKKGDTIRHPINVNELLDKVVQVVRPETFACSCEVATSLADDLPWIEGDPVQLQQVLVNLVTNALDAMRELPLEKRKLEISSSRQGDREVRICVRDHGSGIAAEARERLFDQFFTTKEQGLGMGLAIVRSIVEAHGGKIDAENAPDGGARFYFDLPVLDKSAT